MIDLFQKSTTQSTKKLHIGAALWDGFIYPFRSTEIIRVYLFCIICSIPLVVVPFVVLPLVIMFLVDIVIFLFNQICVTYGSYLPPMLQRILNELPARYEENTTEFYMTVFTHPIVFSLIVYTLYCTFIIFLAIFYGYFITVIQNSLKDNNKLPRFKFKNVKRLFTLGIKAGIILALTTTTELARALLGSVLSYFSIVKSTLTIEFISINEKLYSFIIYAVLIFISQFFVPSLLVTFSRRGRLSDLLPLNQYIDICKDKNYIKIAILYILITYINNPFIYIEHWQVSANNYFNNTAVALQLLPYILIILVIINPILFISVNVISSRIIGKQWKTIKKHHGHRKLLCDTTIQKKLDDCYSKR